MGAVEYCIGIMNSKGFSSVWYQNLGGENYNVGFGNLIYYKIESGVIIWELKQYV